MKFNFRLLQKQSYVTDPAFPAFLIYRNGQFDTTAAKLTFNVFDVFRDRQITKNNTTDSPTDGSVWVIKGRNLSLDGQTIEHIVGYDRFISASTLQEFSVHKFLNRADVYLTPNMTYYPRVFKNIPDVVPDGSVAVLIPKISLVLSREQLDFFSSEEYRQFYTIARNLSTQSINVDSSSVFFYGVLNV